MTTSLLAFVPVIVLLVLLPGANNLVVLRETIAGGGRAGARASAGTSLGIALWATAVAVGIGSLVRQHPHVWALLQWTGAATLVLLGAWGVLRARQAPDRPESPPGHRFGHGFYRALATSLGNPRTGISAVTLLPQFVTPPASVALTILALGAIWAVLGGAWNLAGVLVVRRSRTRLAGPRTVRRVETAAGMLLVLVGSRSWSD